MILQVVDNWHFALTHHYVYNSTASKLQAEKKKQSTGCWLAACSFLVLNESILIHSIVWAVRSSISFSRIVNHIVYDVLKSCWRLGESKLFLATNNLASVFLLKCLILSDEHFFVFRSQNGLDDDRNEPIRSIQISSLAGDRPYCWSMTFMWKGVFICPWSIIKYSTKHEYKCNWHHGPQDVMERICVYV